MPNMGIPCHLATFQPRSESARTTPDSLEPLTARASSLEHPATVGTVKLMSESSQKSSGVGQHSLESSMQSAATTRQEISREIETEWRSGLAGSAAPALFAVTSPVSDKTNKWIHTGVSRGLSLAFKALHIINPAQQLEGSDFKCQLCLEEFAFQSLTGDSRNKKIVCLE